MYSIPTLRSSFRSKLQWSPLEDRNAPGDMLFSAWSPFDGLAAPATTQLRDMAATTPKSVTLFAAPADTSEDAPVSTVPPSKSYAQYEFTVNSRRDAGLENIRVASERVLANEFRPSLSALYARGDTGSAAPSTLIAATGPGSIEVARPAEISVRAGQPESTTAAETPTVQTPTTTERGEAINADGTVTKTFTFPAPQGLVKPTATTTTPYSYDAGGTIVGLNVNPNRIAVIPADATDVGRAALLAKGGAFEGYTMVRGLEHRGMMIDGPNASAWLSQPLPDGVTAIVPVFTPNVAHGTDMTVLDEINVALHPGVDPAAFFSDPRIEGYRRIDSTTDQYTATLAAGTGVVALEVANDLARDPRVEFSEPNFYVNWELDAIPNDPRFNNEWHLRNTGQSGSTVDADVDADLAWDVNAGGTSTRIIAIVDDGVQVDHPDFNIWTNLGEIGSNGIDDDGNGYVDDLNGWNFVGNNNKSGPTTNNDTHGTAVAGVAAARGNNDLGVVGVSYNAQLLSSRIFEGPDVASNAGIAAAVNYAAGRNKSGSGTFASVSVQNNSWGGYGSVAASLTSAFNASTKLGRNGLGTVSATSAGNDAIDANSHYPSNLMLSNAGVFSTGASTNLDALADYSNFGTTVDFVTPSGGGTLNIETTDRTGAQGYDPSDYTGNGANGFSGTSSASPLAAGIAALVISQSESVGVGLTAGQVRSILRNNADIVGFDINGKALVYDTATGMNGEYSRGRLNAFTAVDAVGRAEVSVVTATAEVPSGSSAAFGTVVIGDIATTTYRVRNQGTTDLTLGDPVVTMGAANYIISTPLKSNTLRLGEETTFTVTFAPTATGAQNGQVTFTTNDTSEASFVLNYTGAGRNPTVGGSLFEDWNGNGTRNLNDVGIAGRTVYLDNNLNGQFDPIGFTQKNTPNLAIPDNDPNGITDTISVAGQTGTVNGITVTVNIAHTFDFDLGIALIAPDNTTFVILANGQGGNGKNFTNTVFDDNATKSITTGTAPFTGSFKPLNPLSAMNGQPKNGDWKLLVADLFAPDTGTLLNWTLTFTNDIATTTNSNGGYFFDFADGLPNGPTVVRTIPNPLETPTVGGAGYPITIAGPTVVHLNKNFGVGVNNRVYGRVYHDADLDSTFDATELPVGNQLAFLDDGDGVLNPPPPPFTYVNAEQYPIPDNFFFGVPSSITISDQTQQIVGITVAINALHERDSDMRFTLVSPGGVSIPLVTNRGADGQNFTVTIFDDAAPTPIADGTAPFTGTYRPESPLSVLLNTSPNGTWRLISTDIAADATGTLLAWTLTLSVSNFEARTLTVPNGNFFFDLPGGTSRVTIAPNGTYKPFSPMDGLITVTTNNLPIFERLWGVAEAVRPTVTTPTAVNGGALQHSKVNSTTLTFSEKVTITGPPANAFTVTGPGGTVAFTASVDNTGPTTKVTLSFASALVDGRYTVTADTSLIKDAAGNFMAVPVPITFHQLFADMDGNATVDGADLAIIGNAFGSSTGNPVFRPEVDANNDGTIDGSDYLIIGNFFGTSV